jgi:hypothetical protein
MRDTLDLILLVEMTQQEKHLDLLKAGEEIEEHGIGILHLYGRKLHQKWIILEELT